jgi:hypothetical protein
MANVPELALCMHSKGFVRGVEVCQTNDIPFLNSVIRSWSLSRGSGNKSVPKKSNIDSNSHDDRMLFDPAGSIYHNDLHLYSYNHLLTMITDIYMFIFLVIDFNASTIMRFLKESCREDDGTYILKTSKDGQV